MVRDFTGNDSYEELKSFPPGKKPFGRKVEVTFQDGEILVGSTLGYDLKREGFFMVPADPESNNIRAFLVSSAIKSVRRL